MDIRILGPYRLENLEFMRAFLPIFYLRINLSVTNAL